MTDLTKEQFRRFGYEIVDWIAGYLDNPRVHPVLPDMQPGDLVARLPKSAPETGEPMEQILADFRSHIIPAMTHWNHPRFMAYFSVSASAPGILAEALTATLNTNGMLWKSNPASTELELVTLDWVRQWLGLPEGAFGIIHDTASLSTMHAIAAAREAADPDARTRGGSQHLTLYTSEHAHSSVEKGAIAIGVGQNNVRKVPVDAQFRLRPDALAEMIRADRDAGKLPFCVVPTVGTTSTTAIDPVPAVADIAHREGLWMHVDAAYGGAAAVVPELRHLLDGCDRADSLVMNPHKWFFTPIDLSTLFTRRPDIMRRAFSLVPAYLRTGEDGRVVNYMDYGVALGRRFRALKLWFVLRYFGREGIAAVIREQCRWACELAGVIAAHPRFEVTAPTPLSLVCFRYRGTNDENRLLLDELNRSGEVFVSGNEIAGVFMIRLAIGNMRTTREDVFTVWKVVQDTAARLFNSGSPAASPKKSE
ncbi:MAG: pyridoxal-dependent decarboxylase [Bryobacteraceae bacterium]|nr:pyridoxal-dependent decarboxylase [Bryobacteraceae bacterium]